MKNLLKMIALTVALCAVVPAFAYPDVDSQYWAAKEIGTLTEEGVIIGYPDGNFKPNSLVTRAEFASMAIKALGQEHTTVAQPVTFTDIDPSFWAFDSIQKALYFDLISSEGGGFRPDDTVTRAEAVSMAVNALTTQDISINKAKEVLSKKYSDSALIPADFTVTAGKAEILDMIRTAPTFDVKKLQAERAATRAEVAAILFEMKKQAKLNPNAKLAEAMRRKTGEGYVIKEAYVDGSYGTIPAGAVVPVKLSSYASSQSSQAGDIYTASVPENYITDEKFILVREGANLKGQFLDVRNGRWFVRNGVLVLDNSVVTTVNDQTAQLRGVCEVKKDRNWFMKFVRATLKGEKLDVTPEGVIYVKLLKPLKVDLTNGWIIE